MIIFMVALTAVIDTCLILYHQIAISQAVKKTARRAGTNLYDRTDLARYYYLSVGPTLVASGSNATLTITTQAIDTDFAAVDAPGGKPSVTVNISYDHQLIGAWPWLNTFTLTAESESHISTWTQVTEVTF
jgi:hypothetical protein